MNPADYIKSLPKINFGNYTFSPNYIQAGAIVVLLFLLVLTLASLRQKFVQWSIKGSVFGIFFGFLLALILEGFLILGGKTAVTALLGWKNAPAPATLALDNGKETLVAVLGVTDEIPQSYASGNFSVEDAIKVLQSLDPSEIKKVKALICEP